MAEGLPDKVMALADELLLPAIAVQDELPDVLYWVGGQRVLAMLFAGELDEAETICDAVDQMIPKNLDEPRALLVMARGLVQSARGRPRSAVRLLRESLALAAAGGIAWRLSWIASVLAEAAALAGDTALAVEALSIARANLRPNVQGAEPLLWRAEAWTEFAQHGTTAGREEALRAATRARDAQHPWLEAVCCLDALHFGGGREVATRLEEVSRHLSGRLAPVYAALGRAVRLGDAEALLETAERFGSLGQLLNAAAAAHWASERFKRLGRLQEATAASTLAASWAGRCEGARAPALVAAARAEPAAALTRREREIVLLAAAGKPNREIADILTVSVRTVEGHLARSYAKLGITRRDDLADLGFAASAGNA
jgi:ATP/maltotriose-dependent transcriptional regulator MalT